MAPTPYWNKEYGELSKKYWLRGGKGYVGYEENNSWFDIEKGRVNNDIESIETIGEDAVIDKKII